VVAITLDADVVISALWQSRPHRDDAATALIHDAKRLTFDRRLRAIQEEHS
jgi:hypothetical protein